jgi:hypothetical protein
MHKGGVYTNSRSLEWGHRGAFSIATGRGGGIRDVAEVTRSDLKVPDVVRITTFHGSLDFILCLFILIFIFAIFLLILALSILLILV